MKENNIAQPSGAADPVCSHVIYTVCHQALFSFKVHPYGQYLWTTASQSSARWKMVSRRQRKGAGGSTAAAKDITDAAGIPLAQPPKDTPRDSSHEHPTLLEIAAEQQANLLGLSKESRGTGSNIEVISTSSSGEILRSPASGSTPRSRTVKPRTVGKVDDDDDDSGSIPPLPDTIFLSLPLSMIHFTLSFLAAHQYAQNLETKTLLKETALVAFPVLTLLVHFSHGHIISFDKFSPKGLLGRRARNDSGQGKKQSNIQIGPDTSATSLMNALFPLSWRNFIFSPLAIFLGMRLISTANEASYYAVMKTTPAIGTLWAWSVLEISVGYAVLGLFVPIVWAVWWKGYVLY